ncbi:sigma factor-like helix-turn-helix DNA-binding protein [Streptomyces sp. NPDC005385]|uniref:RNA polymerase sigma factor n=1 Tax=Streptomyces sp. NPDC005385 TaxID=3157039 RepID=UPI0033BFA3A0
MPRQLPPRTDRPRKGSGQESYDDFFRREFRPLTRHVIFLGASTEDAKDAAQSALIDLLQHWETVDAPRAWVRIAAARYFMRSDAKVNRSTVAARRDFRETREAGTYSLSSPLEEFEFILGFVHKHLVGIQGQVMAWHIDGYEPSEIAEKLNMPPATVRSNLRHARKKLASALRTEYPELAKSMGEAEGKRK